MKFNMPRWLTLVLAGLYLVVAYLIHRPEIVPPEATILHLKVTVLLTDILLGLGMLGINGPQLLPQLAGLLGNPQGPPAPVVPPVDPR